MTRKGTLYLIPNTLGEETDGNALSGILPETVADITASLDYFIVENAKSARAHLKRIDKKHPLKHPLQQIRMAELNVRTDKSRLPELLEPLMSGQDGGLISRGRGTGHGRSGSRSGTTCPRKRHFRQTTGRSFVLVAGADGQWTERSKFRFQRLLAHRCRTTTAAHPLAGRTLAPRQANPDFHRDTLPKRHLAQGVLHDLQAGHAVVRRYRPDATFGIHTNLACNCMEETDRKRTNTGFPEETDSLSAAGKLA